MRFGYALAALAFVATPAMAADYEKDVAAATVVGQPVQIGSHTSSWDGRCMATAMPTFVVLTPPKNGAITTQQGTAIAGKGSTGSKSCNGRTFPAMLVIYQPTAGFHGDDLVQYAVRYPSGQVTRNVTVHVQ